MRENDIFGVKPLKELLEIIKEQINDSFDKIMRKQYDDFTKYDKNVQKRKESDLDNIYKEYIKKKRKISEISENLIQKNSYIIRVYSNKLASIFQ